jgi:hypothetical protein
MSATPADPARHGIAIIYRPADSEPVEPRLWSRAFDGRLWTIMCRDCNTLGGHDQNCRRTTAPSGRNPVTAIDTAPVTRLSLVEQIEPLMHPALLPVGLIPQLAAAPGNVAGLMLRGQLHYAASVLDVWASLLRSTGNVASGRP